jgi:MYXO-CTERM domain-containing protein
VEVGWYCTGEPSVCATQCGDGILAGVEVCDDGNTNDGDGCSADCSSNESCGNNILDTAAGEVCDDGNINDGDGCSANCRSDETCGNNVTDTPVGEMCDDGNTFDGDGCSADCLSDETCGNGVLDDLVGEQCDDGNNISGDGCEADCTEPPCGNGRLDEGEACDDGNTVSGDGCSADCLSDETCGNGVLDDHLGEECDDGLFNSDTFPNACRMNCRPPFCGDNVRDDGEECDDGQDNNDEAGPCNLVCQLIDDNGGGAASRGTCGCTTPGGGDTGRSPLPLFLVLLGLLLIRLRRNTGGKR